MWSNAKSSREGGKYKTRSSCANWKSKRASHWAAAYLASIGLQTSSREQHHPAKLAFLAHEPESTADSLEERTRTSALHWKHSGRSCKMRRVYLFCDLPLRSIPPLVLSFLLFASRQPGILTQYTFLTSCWSYNLSAALRKEGRHTDIYIDDYNERIYDYDAGTF